MSVESSKNQKKIDHSVEVEEAYCKWLIDVIISCDNVEKHSFYCCFFKEISQSFCVTLVCNLIAAYCLEDAARFDTSSDLSNFRIRSCASRHCENRLWKNHSNFVWTLIYILFAVLFASQVFERAETLRACQVEKLVSNSSSNSCWMTDEVRNIKKLLMKLWVENIIEF